MSEKKRQKRVNMEKLQQLLGWQADSGADNLCRGYYLDPVASTLTPEQQASGEIRLRADEVSLVAQGRSRLEGNVHIEQEDKILFAEQADLFRSPEGDITDIALKGGVRVYQPRTLLMAEQVSVNLPEKSGQADNVAYRFVLQDTFEQSFPPPFEETLYAWGHAERVAQYDENVREFNHASFTTCPPGDDAWMIRAKRLILDQEKNIGKAYGATFYTKNVPTGYVPYVSFPLHQGRTTGFLWPVFGYSNDSGFEVATPFYWNIAPNYDATIAPVLYSERGVMFDNEFRYLLSNSEGAVNITVLPDDRAYRRLQQDNPDVIGGNSARASVNFIHFTQLNDEWSGGINYNWVSDDFYYQDFGNSLSSLTSNQLLQQAHVEYINDHWYFLSRVQAYQTLKPFGLDKTRSVHSRLPQFMLNAYYPEVIEHVDFQLNTDFNYFYWPGAAFQPQGFRSHINPGLSATFENSAAYVKPTIQLQQTNYALDKQFPGFSKNINRSLPMFNVDSGLLLEREGRWLGDVFTQTLEPRIYYLYVPFVDQSQIPDFETTYYIFNYQQLFRNNRFAGIDRIGDANQLSVALSTRFLNASGEEKLRAGIGQIYYFANRRVMISDVPGEDSTFIGFTSPTDSFSPIVGELFYHINDRFKASADWAWDPNRTRTNNAYAALHFTPKFNTIVSAGYSFLANGERDSDLDPSIRESHRRSDDLHQVTFSYILPINQRWSTLGVFNYNVSERYPMEYFFGLEYSDCCWAIRAVGGEIFKRLDVDRNPSFSQRFYIQILLKGLGSVGSSSKPTAMISNQVPSYYDIFR